MIGPGTHLPFKQRDQASELRNCLNENGRPPAVYPLSAYLRETLGAIHADYVTRLRLSVLPICHVVLSSYLVNPNNVCRKKSERGWMP